MPGKSYCRRLRSLLSCLYDVFQATVNFLVRSFFTCALGLVLSVVWLPTVWDLFIFYLFFSSPFCCCCCHFFLFFICLIIFFSLFVIVLLSMQLHFIAGHSLGSLTCTQMSMHVTAHGGCANSERKSAPKVDFGREEKSVAAAKIRTRFCSSSPRNRPTLS